MFLEYKERTSTLRDSNLLFVALKRPYDCLKPCTLRLLFIRAMQQAGIDTEVYTPHSARRSVTAVPGLTMEEILQLGCWRKESTYRQFYEAVEMS